MKKLLLIMLCIICLSFKHASANENTKNLYFSGALGLSLTDNAGFNDQGIAGDVDFKGGANLAAALGFRVNNWFSTELEFSHRSTSIRSINVDGVGSFNTGGDSNVTAALLNVNLHMPTGTRLIPFISSGIGGAYHDASIDDVTGVLIGSSADDAGFAYQLGAGIDLALSEEFELWTGYRYFATSDPDLGGIDFDYSSHEWRLGMRKFF
ncbi:MAG: porin family protein [Rhodospirillales bacterium]|nr:porin family protein [Rhodospirillales bacterium]